MSQRSRSRSKSSNSTRGPWFRGNQFDLTGVPVQEIDQRGSGAPIDDAELIRRAKQGNQHAIEDLVRRYQDVAFRVACLITTDPDEAQDAAQTAFIKAFRALESFRDESPFRPWLLRIVANEAKNRVRSLVRRASDPLDERIVALRPSPEELAERSEQQRALLRAIRALGDDDQRIIACRYFLDLSELEMADLLECPRGTVKSRLSRATGRLREALIAQSGGEVHVYRATGMPDFDLDAQLTALGAQLTWVPTPDLLAGVLGAPASSLPVRFKPPRHWLLVAALLAVILGGAILLGSRTVRTSVADFLGIDGLRIELGQPDTTPVSQPILGTPTTMQDFERWLPFTPMQPAEFGSPDAVYLRVLENGDSSSVSPPGMPTDTLPEASETGFGALLMQFAAPPEWP